MDSLKEYIIEKFKINSKTVNHKYTFKHIDEKEASPFCGYNWILNNSYFNTCYTFLNLALEECVLREKEEEFIKDFIKDIENYYKRHNIIKPNKNRDYVEETEILNGKTNNGLYKRPKCIYDISKFIKEKEINKGLKDKFGEGIDGEPDNIIFDLENTTDKKIEYLDWDH